MHKNYTCTAHFITRTMIFAAFSSRHNSKALQFNYNFALWYKIAACHSKPLCQFIYLYIFIHYFHHVWAKIMLHNWRLVYSVSSNR